MEFNIENYHLKSTALLDYLSVTEKNFIKNKIQRKEFNKGAYLFREKSYPKGIYVIRKGKVKIFQTNSEGKQSIVYIYKKGDYFGYRPILAGEAQPVSAVAMDNVVISFIPKETFMELLEFSGNLANKLLVSLSKEFSVWINKMTVFSQFGVKERVALSLLILNEVYRVSNDNNKKVIINISRNDFAGFVGTAKETLVRMLRFYKDENMIVSKGTKIILQDEEAIRHLVDGF
ncbi:MAG: Crp/Fnr family transcriptional regulator [Bacteroidetes bacterium]|nr:Crp/Fnr family transcriptional regulator [Bacteroidota bacterium]